jgi:hypothetical protein
MSTEEDGVNEAGRTSQSPLIMAPPNLTADPDEDAADTIVDNDIMSSSRKGTGSSRSGVSKRTDGANGDSSTSGDTEAATPEATTGEDTKEAGSSTKVPLPADTIGKVKGQSADSSGATEDKERSSERQGNRKTMSSGDSTWAADRKTETAEPADSAGPTTSAVPAAPAANKTSPVKNDRKPSFTPAAATPTAATPAAAASTAAPTTSTPAAPAPQASSYSGAGASRQGTTHASPSGYSRTAWSAAAEATAPSGSAPASAPARPAPAGGAGTAPSSDNGRSSSNGFSTGAAASTVTGAAAGLASSVSSAWQKRGSARTIQTRKSTKRQAMLTLSRVEPWSVMKFSFVASVVAFIILFVAVAVLYMVLSALGVFDSLQHTVSSITSSQSDSGTNISHWFSASLILGYTAMLGALNIVLITAMSTVGSVIYNLIAKTIGGIEVTLRETD